MKDILLTAEETIKIGEDLGADEVEAYTVLVDRKKVDLAGNTWTLYTNITSGLGVRVIVNKKIGFFATSSLTSRNVKYAVRMAYKIAKLSEIDNEWVSLPTRSGEVDVEGTFDKGIAEIEPNALMADTLQMTDTVKSCGKNLAITRGEVATEMVWTAISNSHKCSMHRKETFASADISVKAEEAGNKGLSSESEQVRNLRELDFTSIARVAAERASKVMYAKQIPSCKMPVVWRNKVFASALRIMFGGTLCADSVQKGRSPWAGKIEKQIASEGFTLVDDGVLRAGLKTRGFDDDGVPQRKVSLIDHGILKGFLFDSYTANKEHRESTGNSSRDYRSLPVPLPNNLILQSGTAKSEELVGDVKRGLYLFETIGVWLSNPISGDLSATATNAFLIEDGILTKPIKGVIVSGNFFHMMRSKVELVANDIQNLGSTYSPSVRISDMTVTGE